MLILGSAMTRLISALVMSLAFLGSAANAGAWEEFERRCLAPMEDFDRVDTSEMQFLGKRDGPTMLSAYLPPSQGFLFLVVTDDADSSLGCSVNLGENASAETQDEFAARFVEWSTAVTRDGSYEKTEDTFGSDDPAISLQSNLTREPVLAVSLWRQFETNTWVASVQETDLES